MNPLHGKTALVTGSSRGIGRAIAVALARAGAAVVVNYLRREAEARAVEKEIAGLDRPCIGVQADVSIAGDVERLVRTAEERSGPIDILINNAGIAHANLPVEKLPLPVWKDVLETNLTGTFLITQAALAIMKRGSTIVNNLSIAANRVFPGSAAYNASKHGALGLINTLREELRPRGIRVIALLPGATDTDIWTTLWPEAPRKKMMSPATVAEAVVQAILLPANATVESLEILPTAGTL